MTPKLTPNGSADGWTPPEHAVGASEFGPYRPVQIPAILAELEATARRSRSAWRHGVTGGTLTIEEDPDGLVDDLAVEWPLLRRELRGQQQAVRVAWMARQVRERVAVGQTIAAIATALGVSRRTVERARSCDTNRASMSLATAESGMTMVEMNRSQRIA